MNMSKVLIALLIVLKTSITFFRKIRIYYLVYVSYRSSSRRGTFSE